MAAINVSDLTKGTVSGDGIFDKLMQATKAHLDDEYSKNRIKGPEYSTVYLGALQAVMDRSLQFLLSQQKVDLEAQLMSEQITTEQAQQAILGEQELNLQAERTKIIADTALITAQEANAITQNTVLIAQECKLRAEFDQLEQMVLKTVAETALLAQKKVTETSQTAGTGVDADSVVGKQKALYQAQTDGFARDGEQKAAKLFIDTWNVRRTTQEATDANAVNKLNDDFVGRAVQKLLEGINA